MSTATAAQLIREGLCSALCLAAAHREALTCNCPCGGAYHAHFAAMRITLAPGHTLTPAQPMPGQLTLDFSDFGVSLDST
jgi:hypothetical protein